MMQTRLQIWQRKARWALAGGALLLLAELVLLSL